MSVLLKRLNCLYCNRELSGFQTKFCCKSCAAKYNNTQRHTTTKGKTKIVRCTKCDSLVEVSLHAANNYVCKACRDKDKKLNKTIILTKEHNVNKYDPNICIYNPNDINHIKKCEGCFFGLNNICTKNKSSIAQHIKNLTTISIFGFDKDSIGTTKMIDEYFRIKEILINMYYKMRMSGEDIDKLAGKRIWYNLGNNFFKIKSRNFQDAALNTISEKDILNHAENQYKTEWHKTWDNKEVFLRSSYETDYANELDKQQIIYEVEFKKIKYFDSQTNKYRCAIPDFYIPSINTIVEIKSIWTLNEQNMRDKFKAYHKLGYNTKLILEHKEVKL